MSGTTVKNFYEDSDDFEVLLDEADSNASDAWEMEFCSKMKINFDMHGEDMFLSNAQHESLLRISGRGR